jgi:hypothetical protein
VDGTRIKIQSLDKQRNPVTIDIDFHYVYRNRISINEEIFNFEIKKSLSYNYEKYFLPALKNFEKDKKTAFEKIIYPALELIFSLQACQSEDKNKNVATGSLALGGLGLGCDCYALSNPVSLASSAGYAVYKGAQAGINDKSLKSFCENSFKNLPVVRSLYACNDALKGKSFFQDLKDQAHTSKN